jgi:hypothetical protein
VRIVFLGNFAVDHSSETHHANTLEQLGHTVERLQETEATAQDVRYASLGADLFVWVHTHGWDTPGDMRDTLTNLETISMSYHLDRWLGLQRQVEIGRDPVFQVDYWFTVDQMQADWLNSNTATHAKYLPAGVYGRECYCDHRDAWDNDVIFVGSRGYHPEYSYRPKLVDWLSTNYLGFQHWGGDGLGTIRGHALNQLYANTKVVVGDSLRLDGDDGSYWSDRVYETLGRGGFLIHPRLSGLEQQFKDGEHLAFYDHGDFDQLKFLIDYYLEDDVERERIRRAGHELVKAQHSYINRWQTILDTLELA